MRYLLLLCCLLTTSAFSECAAEKILDKQQMTVVRQAYALGIPHDLGYSLAAIVWQESGAGKWLINVQEHSYGPFQINLKTAIRRTGDGLLSPFQQNVLATSLLDLRFASTYAIQELEYWQSVHGREHWRSIWASYNGGWRYGSPLPQRYADNIINKIALLKNCFNEGLK